MDSADFRSFIVWFLVILLTITTLYKNRDEIANIVMDLGKIAYDSLPNINLTESIKFEPTIVRINKTNDVFNYQERYLTDREIYECMEFVRTMKSSLYRYDPDQVIAKLTNLLCCPIPTLGKCPVDLVKTYYKHVFRNNESWNLIFVE